MSESLTSNQERSPLIEVEFESYGPSKYRQTARFDLGTEEENGLEALRFAHNHNARTVRSEEI